MSSRTYDVAIVGAGPAGSVTALAFAARGRRVVVFEANPRSKERLAGEWLHPPALAVLERLGVTPRPAAPYASGRGFAVFPDDGSAPIVLPYHHGSFGLSLDHARLVDALHAAVREHPGVELFGEHRVTRIAGQHVFFVDAQGRERHVSADLVVGASGRASIAHAALGIRKHATPYSRMAGLKLTGVELPFEGFGHVLLGGPGPMLAYRLDERAVRLCLDVPLSVRAGREPALLYEAYGPVLPGLLRPAFARALAEPLSWASNQIRPRTEFGREGLALVGDAVGHYHPLTALGMTLGFGDAVALAESGSVAAYRRRRQRETRVPEMLALALYEVFADSSDETLAIRRAVYRLWRSRPAERLRTMRFLAGEDRSSARFVASFATALAYCGQDLAAAALRSGAPGHQLAVTRELGERLEWLLRGMLHLTEAGPLRDPDEFTLDTFGPALRASAPRGELVEHPARRPTPAREPVARALARATEALLREQGPDGSFEGEVVWGPLLAAQYVLTCHVLGRPIPADRARRILRAFELSRLEGGAYGLHDRSAPYLFVTTLVYVAARLLGVDADDPRLAGARAFLAREGGAAAIPSWGKLWLAMLSLYGWDGVPPIAPELWTTSPAWPFHPSRYYCHTRLIYLAMAAVYGARVQAPLTPVVSALRDELFPGGYEATDFSALRHTVRAAELYARPSPALRVSYELLGLAERARSASGRAEVLAGLREEIRYELRSTSHTSISPVSGLLNIIALWAANPDDPDVERALAAFEGWVWEDEAEGFRVAGARSMTWDTAFALQALGAADAPEGRRRAADRYLAAQQIRQAVGDPAAHGRLDPVGGFCFAGAWHGWPVSDCTAEALVARLRYGAIGVEDAALAVDFLLRTRNPDGGFGSYEARRSRVPLEWLNPAEMFGDSMTEHSYVECTASALEALVEFRHRHPRAAEARRLDEIIAGGARKIRALQRPDGAWTGNWGVRDLYGTYFALRGLAAAGVPSFDPDVRRGCRWLLAQQRPDGGFAEPGDGPRSSLVTSTAWALLGLLAAGEPDFDALDRAGRFLAERQGPDGSFPAEPRTGIFFHTALLDYPLYRSYFPVWALAELEARRARRAEAPGAARSVG